MTDTEKTWTKLQRYTRNVATHAKDGVGEQAGHVAALFNKIGDPEFGSKDVTAAGAGIVESALKYAAGAWARTRELLDDLAPEAPEDPPK